MRRALTIGVLAAVTVAGAPAAAAQTDPGTAAIQAKYAAMGGDGPLHGWADLPGGGKVAKFPKWGTTVAITWNQSFGAHWFSGNINAKWSPDFGAAVADQTGTVGRPGAAAGFANGVSIYYSDTTGAHALSGEVRTKYWQTGHTAGPLGFPESDVQRVDGARGGWFAHFQGMVTIYAPDGELGRWISGALRQRYWDRGGVAALGFPVGDQWPTHGRTGYAIDLDHARAIYWSPATGAQLLEGSINGKYRSTGIYGPYGPFGFPVSEAEDILGGTRARFENTVQIVAPTTGSTRWISGDLASLWWYTLGGPEKLGLPTSDQLPTYGANGLYSLFGPNAAIIWGPTTGAKLVSDGFLARLRADGDVANYGLPETMVLDLAGREGWSFQQFQNASIFQANESALTVGWQIRSVWWSAGGYGGALGLPTDQERDLGDHAEQSFEGGVVGCFETMPTCYYQLNSGQYVTVPKPNVGPRR